MTKKKKKKKKKKEWKWDHGTYVVFYFLKVVSYMIQNVMPLFKCINS